MVNEMAETYFKDNLIDNVEPIGVITGDKDYKKVLYYQLKMSIIQASKIDIIVSFLMESGVKILLKDLREALDRGVQIRLLTGNYLGITQPSALYLIKKELGDRVDLRFYNDNTRSFHPKAYIFHYKKGGEIFIGSSNISFSALTSGIEWNYRLVKSVDKENFDIFLDTFNDLFNNHSIVIDEKVLKEYSKNWKKPSVAKDLSKYDNDDEDTKVRMLFQPRGAQIEALYALEQTREDGATKGLVQAATGVGKTYLAAFDSINFKRVLFVAHREEILKQAAVSFKNVRNTDDYGFFMGNVKDTGKSLIFASVASLGKKEYLNNKYFEKDYFDYIVIDEFHHAVTSQYQNIIEYFNPKFLLGLTATPERMDCKNIYEICDYNVPYEIGLKEAINKGILVPFHYYGIYDETDYSNVKFVRGRYEEKELNKIYIDNVSRYNLIYKHYMKYRPKRTLGFCCSRMHAEAMAKAFTQRGIPSVAVYSNANGEFSEDREIAISKLVKGEIKVIFSVDMFNEGVDVPSVDMVMFLRPTESPVVFFQQLGRGLRTNKGKDYLIVLDFIGNYQKAGRIPFLLTGDNESSIRESYNHMLDIEYPDGCIVDFDMPLIDLFTEIEKQRELSYLKKLEKENKVVNKRKLSGYNVRVQDSIKEEFFRIKELLNGKIPTRMDLFTYMDSDIYELCLKISHDNIFKNYLEFKQKLDVLNDDEKKVYESVGKEFLHVIETTSMTKVYKMPILNSFYNDGNFLLNVTKEQLLVSWKKFFNKNKNWKDLKKNISYDQYKKITDKEHLTNIMRNPVHFLKESGFGYFIDKEGYAIALNENLADLIKNPAFVQEYCDIIKYRTMEYYHSRYKAKENS